MAAPVEAACADAVLMVRPAAFGANVETAASNRFQQPGSGEHLAETARRECEGLAAALAARGIEVFLLDDTAVPVKPDACFPNNWVSLHGDGTLVAYPMLARSRRAERRLDLLAQLRDRGGFRITRSVDLTYWESSGRFLEGTGSLVLDRPARLAYACLSPRTDPTVLQDFAEELGYRTLVFPAVDAGGVPVYHTNVVMGVGERFAVICDAAIPDPAARERVLAALADGGRDVIRLSLAQMHAFAGNLLQLATRDGGRVVALSTTAWAALDAGQRGRLEAHGEIVAAPIPTIERYGGGSVRCMLAEIFLPRAGGHAGACRAGPTAPQC